MSVTTEKTVRELALENPAATRVFEKLGIDYCCGGNQSLEQACRAANLPVDQVLDSLEMAEQTTRVTQKIHDWQREPLGDLVAHINTTHHKYTREEIARLGPLLESVLGPRQKPSRTAAHSRELRRAGTGTDHAHDEGRDGVVPLHRQDGGGCHSE